MRKFQDKKFIFPSMGASILLSIIPFFAMGVLGTRGSEDFTALALFLLAVPILLGAPFSLLHLFAFKKNIDTDTARKLMFFPSIWVQIFIVPIIILLTFSIIEELLGTHYFHVKWAIPAITFDALLILYFFSAFNIRKKLKVKFFDEKE